MVKSCGLVGGSQFEVRGRSSCRRFLPAGSPPSSFVLIIRGDISDAFMQPNGIVLLTNSGELSSQGLRVTELGQMWILRFDVPEE